MKTILFSRNRILVALMCIGLLLAAGGLNEYLPIGPGNYNQRQIDKIHVVLAADHFSFAVMGDNRNGFTTLKKILNDIDSNHYLFALDNGDLISNGRKIGYRIFFNIIKNEKTPFLTGIGNHEIINGGEKYYFEIFGKPYYSFDYDNSLFIVLDDSNTVRVDTVQMKWLEQQLQKKYHHRFVFLHTPPFDPRPGKHQSLKDGKNAKEFMALMERYKPDIVFTSHIHGYFEETRNGVLYVITGGAGAKAEEYKTHDAHFYHHYVKVNVNGDKVSKEVIRIPHT